MNMNYSTYHIITVKSVIKETTFYCEIINNEIIIYGINCLTPAG